VASGGKPRLEIYQRSLQEMLVNAAEEDQITVKLIERWEQVCQKLEQLAEVIPDVKFDHRPAEAVRSVAEVLRHVAFWNQYVADRTRGKKPDDSTNEIPKDKYSTKAQIMSALNRSAAEATNALREKPWGLRKEIAEMLVTFIEHNCEHYGQLVVYARLNGIVPPASHV
jgi:uncharacterized damage-inducible protein DinB